MLLVNWILYYYLIFLAYPMRPILGLQIHLWIPITIEYDNRISRLQIEPQPPRPSTQQEYIIKTVFCVELGHAHCAFFGLGVPVQPQVAVRTQFEEVLKDVEHVSHLAED